MSDAYIKGEINLGILKASVSVPLRLPNQKKVAKESGTDVDVVTKRFVQLFADHGVQRTQIPQFLPQVSLEALSSADKLLPALTSSVLDKTAELFGIRREWLDGVSENIYRCRHCYKAPQRFFDDLRECYDDDAAFSVRALTTTMELDRNGGRGQDLVIIMLKTIKRTHDDEIYSYVVYGDAWDWSYAPSRIQLKAMARLFYQATDCPVPLFKVSRRALEKVREGLTVPRALTEGCLLTQPALEDYALTQEESVQAREPEELDRVLNYIETKGLEAKVESLFGLAQVPQQRQPTKNVRGAVRGRRVQHTLKSSS